MRKAKARGLRRVIGLSRQSMSGMCVYDRC